MKAYEEIYNLYAKDVYRYLLGLTRDINLAEELTQETFYKAYKGIDKFEGHCKLSVWLCQIAKNSFYTYHKKEKLKNHEKLEENIISDVDIQDNLIKTYDTIILHKILHNLEEPYKEVFNLRIFGELTHNQIGEIFGKSESWARVTYYRAKEKIKRKFNEEEDLK